MPDCSELKEAYEKAKLEAEMSRMKADWARDRYEDSEDDLDFESERDYSLHTIRLPDGTAVPDTEAQADCLREKQRAIERSSNKKGKNEARMREAESNASWDERAAASARTEWCACEEENSHGGEEEEPELELGDWNEGDWDDYMVA